MPNKPGGSENRILQNPLVNLSTSFPFKKMAMDFSLCSPHFPTNPGSSSTPTSAYGPSIAKTLRCQKGHDTGGTAVDPTPAVHQDAIVRLLRQGSVDDAKCHLYNLMGPIWRQIHVYVCVLCIYILCILCIYTHT